MINDRRTARDHDPVAAEGLAAVSRLVDITRADVAALEQILLMGTNTEKPLTARVARLEEKLVALHDLVQQLDGTTRQAIEGRKKSAQNKEVRLKKLERLVAMITGAIILVGAVGGYVMSLMKLD